MSTILTILFFLTLLFIALFGQTKARFTAIFMGLLFFPHIIAFRNSPYISPHTLLLYLPLFMEYFKAPSSFKTALKEFPLKAPLFIFSVTCAITAAHISGGTAKNLYDMFRYAFDTYAFFFLAYWFGLHLSVKEMTRMFFPPLVIFASLGFIEFLIGANYPYKMICTSFPVYQGIYDLNSSISLSQDWRSRICITTHHPNTLVPMLLSIIFLWLPIFKQIRTKEKILFCGLFALVFIAGSRTGIVCLAGLMAIYATRKLPIIAKAAIIFFVLLFLSYHIYNFIDYFNSGKGSSLDMRQEQLLFALAMFFHDPIFGNGTGYMADNIFEVDAYGEKKLINSSIGALESFLFRLLIDFGVIGLFAQVVIIGFLCFYFYKRRKTCTAALSGLYITLATYIFVFLAGDSAGTFRFTFLIIGLCLGNCRTHDEEQARLEEEKSAAHLESDGSNESNLSDERPSLN